MDYGVIITIGVIAGFVCFALLSLAWLINAIFSDTEDFEDVRISETFNLPQILIDIEEKEKAATRSNE